MKVAVITPYFKEPESWLRQCVKSVGNQSYPCTHFLVSDGYPQGWIDSAGLRHVQLGQSHGDYGNTPRGIGALLAVSEGFDAICFLDADNTFEPDHVESCLRVAVQGNLDYVVAGRKLVREDGSEMKIAVTDDLDGTHVDTNCYFLLFGAFHTLSRWVTAPKPMASLFDRFYFRALCEEELKFARTNRHTVNYLCTWASFYRRLGEEVPSFAKENISTEPVQRWLSRLHPGDRSHVSRMSGVRI